MRHAASLLGLSLVAGCSAQHEVRYGPWSRDRDEFRDFDHDSTASFRWWGDCAFFPAVVVSLQVTGLEPDDAKGATLDAELEVDGVPADWDEWATMQLDGHRLRLERVSDGVLEDTIAFSAQEADPALGRPAVFRALLTFPDGTAHEVEHDLEIADVFENGS